LKKINELIKEIQRNPLKEKENQNYPGFGPEG